ncbi:8139_t:CDS:2, partial [Scutellospora calospora]
DQDACQIKSNVLDEHTIESNLILKRKRQNLGEGFSIPLNKNFFETRYNSYPEPYNGEYSLSDSEIVKKSLTNVFLKEATTLPPDRSTRKGG